MGPDVSTIIEKPQFVRDKMIFGKFKRLHFVGIGGAGMSGIAEILLNLGYQVSGSDSVPSDVTAYLERQGVRIFSGHDGSNVEQADVVVISSAVGESNPEVMQARSAGVPVIKRAEMLGELMRLKFSVGVAGTHGKTTTTSMIGRITRVAGLKPTLIVGGVVAELGTGAALGEGDYLIAEADEYDRSFLAMFPSMAVVLNIEPDHLDCYDDFDHLKESFLTYINRVPFYGSAIIPDDDPNVLEIMPRIARPYATFGFSERADYRAEGLEMKNGRSVFSVSCRGEMLGRVEMTIPGRHNVLNALAAIAASSELDIPFETIAEALREFSGVGRRFEFVGEVNDIVVIDDYAHHPSEIKAVLETARDNYDRRLIAVFQPHLFSRTRYFMDDFAEALSLADKCILTDIYPAREEPIEGIRSENIMRIAETKGIGDFTCVGLKANAAKAVAEIARPGDIVMILGAGSITHIRQELMQKLEQIK